MRKQSLKEKDLDSFCIKHIKEALDKGASVCKPNRNFDLIREKVESIVDTKYKNKHVRTRIKSKTCNLNLYFKK